MTNTPDIPQDLAQEMADLVRWMSQFNQGPFGPDHIERLQNQYKIAREIAARLPKPVDPDLVEAREIVSREWPLAAPQNEHALQQATLAGIKRGRQLAEK